MDQEKIDEYRKQQQLLAEQAEELQRHQELVGSIKTPKEVSVNNLGEVEQKLEDWTLTNFITQNNILTELLEALTSFVATADNLHYSNAGKKNIKELAQNLADGIKAIPKPSDKVSVTNQIDYSKKLDALKQSVDNLEVSPTINTPEVVVNTDFKQVNNQLSDLLRAIKDIKIPNAPKVDFKNLEKAMKDVQKTIAGLSFPVPNYVLPFKDTNNRASQVQLTSAGSVPVDIGSATVTIGAEVEVKNDTGNPVPVSASSLPLPTGAATSALQTQPGVDIGDVTINNASGASAVNIQDGGNSITIDGSLTTLTTLTTLTNITNWGNVVDNGAFVDGTTRLLPAGFIFDEVAGTALTENDAAAARVDSKRSQVFVGEDATTRGQRWSISSGGALKVDNSAVTQPVSGTFWQATQPVSVSSLPLPSGASTSANQSSILTELGDKLDETTFTGRVGEVQASPTANTVLARLKDINTSLGSLTVTVGEIEVKNDSGNPVPVSLASVPSHDVTNVGTFAVQAAQSGTWNINNVSGTISLPTGAATAAKQLADNHNVVVTSAPTTAVTGTFWQATQPVSNAGTFAVQATQATVAAATLSNVSSSATNVTLLASNAARRQAMVFNDSTQVLYLKMGATASATSHTVQLAAGGYYELPQPVYTGIIDGIWASANGSARVTEL